MTAFIWTGGYNVPPTTILDSVGADLLFVAEVIGVGEIAVADERSTDPRPDELARLVHQAHIGGMLSNKAGVTHFHVGPQRRRLKCLRTLIDDFDVPAAWLYPTHVERSEELMTEAIDLVQRGSYVDIDTVEKELPRWLRFYLDRGGDPSRLTVSSDASSSSPANLYEQVRACVVEHGFPLEQVQPLVTANTASVLKLPGKGRLEDGKDTDLVVLEGDSLAVRCMMARGKFLVRDGKLTADEKFLSQSDRSVLSC